MTSKVRASIELRGRRMRYAEVAEEADGYRLLKAGELTLDFDAEEAIFSSQVFLQREWLRKTIGEYFADSSAPYLHVVLPPHHGIYFFAPQESTWSRTEREESLLRDLGMVAGEEALGLLHVSVGATRPATETTPIVWYHVLAISQQGFYRLDQVIEPLPFARCQIFSSIQGGMMLAKKRIMQVPHGGEDARFLIIGRYRGHTEFGLGRGDAWIFAHDEPVDAPSDIVYYALKVLEKNRVEPRSLAQIWLYGEVVSTEGLEPLTHITGCLPERLDPFTVVPAETAMELEEPSAMVPCIGSAL